jgi:hypothetical protein
LGGGNSPLEILFNDLFFFFLGQHFRFCSNFFFYFGGPLKKIPPKFGEPIRPCIPVYLYTCIPCIPANEVRSLGMIVDSRLSFQDQANEIRRRVNFGRSRLWHYADVTPVLTRKRLVQSLIVPYILYCDFIYSHASFGGG